MISSPNCSLDTIKTVMQVLPSIEHMLQAELPSALLAGKPDVAAFLIEKSMKNGGYGLSEFYSLALTNKSAQGALGDIKKPSVTKKAFGMGNISPLHCACLNPNVQVLEHLLNVSPDYLNIDICLRKPVHYAACCSSPGPLKLLLDKNVDAREVDNLKTTPLMYACRIGNEEVIKLLLTGNRSVPEAKDKMGKSAIHYAAENGHHGSIKLLVEAGVRVNLPGPDRMTALHIASAAGHFDTVKFLLEKGAKILSKDKLKRSSLLLAAKNGNLVIASYLLSLGALFDEADSSGNTPLHYACAYGYPETIDILLQAGANPNSANSWKLSPTAVALLKSYSSCLRKMLDNPKVDVNCLDDEGRTLISNAIQSVSQENVSLISFLLREK